MNRIGILTCFGFIATVILIGGCSPASTGIKLAVKVVGKAVATAEVQDLEEKLMGQRPAAADRQLGDRLDVVRDVSRRRYWLLYAVKLDPLNMRRYMVEVRANRITAISLVEKGGQTKVDIPRKIILKEKVKGKTPTECQAEIKMGRPLLEVRRDSDGRLVQLYDARMIKGLGGIYYCLLRYDKLDRCEELEFVSVASATKTDITE